MACILTTVICSKESAQYVTVTVYAYVGFSVASLVVDLTFAAHFGLDYTYLGNQLLKETTNKELFVLYYGAFALMTISLKGYVAHAINLVFLVLLVIYAAENWNQQKDEHSIHKMGALNAFEHGRKPDDDWTQHPSYPPFTRSSHINNGFINDEDRPRSPVREATQPDYMTNRSFDRSDSWHHSRAPRDLGQNSRPFSYLEDIRRPVAVRPPASPTVDPHWRRDQWPPVAGPPVPAPDYSPQTPRRLKSALKSGY
ncbi:hypothetical protein O3G_MSEX009517 [Manduca sexta]|uniref:Uncharacterized protein n=1 Tax=Manduca sexta TaxID=7130 RepID=A0A922CS94_MANSE|nr:hypothetical protein O3G_MSEX009517 [Manduca sexta]